MRHAKDLEGLTVWKVVSFRSECPRTTTQRSNLGVAVHNGRNDRRSRCLGTLSIYYIFYILTLKCWFGFKAIFILSGDPNFYQNGEKTGIPYNVYHNYYRQQLLSGTPWAKSIFKFFNDALFPDTSSSAPSSTKLAANISDDLDWEAAFECAFTGGGPGPLSQALGLVSAVAAPVLNAPPSISAPSNLTAVVAAPVPNDPPTISAPFNPTATVFVPATNIPAVPAAEASMAPAAPAPTVPEPAIAAVPQIALDNPSGDGAIGVDNNLAVEQVQLQMKAKGGAAKSKRKGKANTKGSGTPATANDINADPVPTSATSTRRSNRAKH